MSKKQRLIDKAASIKRPAKESFLDKLAKPQRNELEELKEMYVSGKLVCADGVSPTVVSLARLVRKEFGIKVSDTTFRTWMRS